MVIFCDQNLDQQDVFGRFSNNSSFFYCKVKLKVTIYDVLDLSGLARYFVMDHISLLERQEGRGEHFSLQQVGGFGEFAAGNSR